MTKKDNEEGVSVSVTVFSLDVTSCDSLFLEILRMGLGVEMWYSTG